MSSNFLETESLSRIESLLDALETRGKGSRDFLALCEKLQMCLETVQLETITPEQLANVSVDLKNRLESIVKRITMLELFANTQTEITSNLQKHIVDADK